MLELSSNQGLSFSLLLGNLGKNCSFVGLEVKHKMWAGQPMLHGLLLMTGSDCTCDSTWINTIKQVCLKAWSKTHTFLHWSEVESLERRWKDGSLNTVGHLLQLWGEGSRHTGSRARMGRKKPDPSDIIWAPELTPGFTTGRVSYVSQYILFSLNPVLVGPITGNQWNPYTCEGLSAPVELKLLVFRDWSWLLSELAWLLAHCELQIYRN